MQFGLAVMTELNRNNNTYLNVAIVEINLTFYCSMVPGSFKLLNATLEKLFSFKKKNNSNKFRVFYAQLFLNQASNSLADLI